MRSSIEPLIMPMLVNFASVEYSRKVPSNFAMAAESVVTLRANESLTAAKRFTIESAAAMAPESLAPTASRSAR